MSTPSSDRFHRDPFRWVFGFLYFAPADRRLVVPKRRRAFGWTPNFARPLAVPLLLAVLGALLSPVVLVLFQALPPVAALSLEAVLTVALIVLCVRLADRRNA